MGVERHPMREAARTLEGGIIALVPAPAPRLRTDSRHAADGVLGQL